MDGTTDEGRDFDAAADLLKPNSKLGPLFGVTSKDIERAAKRLREEKSE